MTFRSSLKVTFVKIGYICETVKDGVMIANEQIPCKRNSRGSEFALTFDLGWSSSCYFKATNVTLNA